MEERYSIREIARLTGLTAATLRKWEERYEIVHPLRLTNGYREYSREDLAALLWMKTRVDGGALVSTAATELKERLAQGWQPTLEPFRQPQSEQSSLLATRQEALLTALLERDPPGVTAALDGAFASFGLETVLIDVVQGVFYEIGRMWASGEISAYQEHYSTVLLRDRLLALRSFVGSTTGPLFVTACMPGEQHEIGALTLGLLAARRGFRVIHLGYSPSPDGVRQALLDLRPQVLGLSVTVGRRLHENDLWLRTLGETAQAETPGSLVVVGGQGVVVRSSRPDGVEMIPGSAPGALAEIQQLLEARR